jgi:hypothetical protein
MSLFLFENRSQNVTQKVGIFLAKGVKINECQFLFKNSSTGLYHSLLGIYVSQNSEQQNSIISFFSKNYITYFLKLV